VQTSEFDRDIAVRRTTGDDTAASYAADLDGGWTVGAALNGGYLLAVVGSALRAHFPAKPDPITLSATYASASVPGPAEVRVDVRRDGGSLTTAVAELWQGDDLRVTVLATYGDLARFAAGSDLTRVTAVEPDMPPPEDCPPSARPKDGKPSMRRKYEMRFHPQQAGWLVGEPGHTGVIGGYYRLVDGREPDPLVLLQVVDALPPVTFDLGMPGWAPTLELTAHVRATPASGWLKVQHATRNLAGGMFEEDCEVWDSAGVLVAQARQLARLPR